MFKYLLVYVHTFNFIMLVGIGTAVLLQQEGWANDALFFLGRVAIVMPPLFVGAFIEAYVKARRASKTQKAGKGGTDAKG